jgi:hypothetical protein
MLRKWYRSPPFRHHAPVLWFRGLVGAVLAALLTAAWRVDRGVRRRGSRVLHHSDVWRDVRDSRRDAEATSVFSNDNSWSSWSRRNRR